MFEKKLLLVSLVITTCLANPLYSAKKPVNKVPQGKFPRGCEVTGFGYNGPNLVVNQNGDQTYYLVQNRSMGNIEMQRVELKDEFMSPSLTAKMLPENWSALASDVAGLSFQCFQVQDESSAKVDCREVLDVCQYPRARFALSNMGNYWVSINKSQQEVISDSVAKGIYLKW